MLRVLSQSETAGEALIFRENSARFQWVEVNGKISGGRVRSALEK
jgi:hypothetical protein